jgi:hypothetical protein
LGLIPSTNPCPPKKMKEKENQKKKNPENTELEISGYSVHDILFPYPLFT